MMIRRWLKLISLILAIIAIFFTFELIPDNSKKKLIAFDKEYVFTKQIKISEKFTTDFKSSYGINYELGIKNPYKEKDSIIPVKETIEIFKNGKPVELYGYNSFVSDSYTEYELRLNFINANSKQNRIRVKVEVNVPSPSYQLLVEREYKWILWIINGVIILLTIITGYFGFRKKPTGNNG